MSTDTPPRPGPADPRGHSVAPELVRLARGWPTTVDPQEVPTDPYAHIWPQVTRCADVTCGQRIVPPDTQGTLVHLMRAHGFRMDGIAYDNSNRSVSTAEQELSRLAGS